MSHIPDLLLPYLREYIEWIIEVLWEGEKERAITIFLDCENREINHHAVGELGERGIAQLHPVHAHRFWEKGWSWNEAFDPVKNLWIAKEIHSEQGWRPWSCKP